MYALSMKRETVLFDKIRSGRLILTVSSGNFVEGEIIPIIAKADRNYKVGEAKVVKNNILSADLEVRVRTDVNFIPQFEVEYASEIYKEADRLDLHYLVDTGYVGITSLQRGRYKR